MTTATLEIEAVEALEKLPTPLPIQIEEVEVLDREARLSVSEWAEKYRKLSAKTSDLAGSWSNDYTPFLVEVMDSLSAPGIRQVTLRKCFQSGGTEAGLNFLGWIVSESPAPTLVVMPRDIDASRRVNTRIRPMFESTPSLLRHLDGDLDALNIGKETELDNMILFLAWASSPAALADNPVCNVILDEVGKFRPRSGEEADPVSLAKDRQRTFFSKASLLVTSTPVAEGDLHDREYNTGDRRQWWVRCPHCEGRHVMVWTNVRMDKDPAGEGKNFLDPEVYLAGGHARYVCPVKDCEKPWTESQRWSAVSAGVWAPAGCSVDSGGKILGDAEKPMTTHRSYHVWAGMLHPSFMTIDRLAAAWAESQIAYRKGDIGPLQNFINGQLAEPWAEVDAEVDISILDTRCGTYRSGTVPPGVVMLTAGLDVQLDHVWLLVVGWGFLSECWIVDWERLETGDTSEVENYEVVRQALRFRWPMSVQPADRKEAAKGVLTMPIRKAGIDCAYRPEPVRDFCRAAAEIDIVPVRGDPAVRGRAYRGARVAGPPRGTPLAKVPGAIEERFDLNVDLYKDRLHRFLTSQTEGPGYLHLPADATEDLASQLTAEKRVPVRDARGRAKGFTWKVKKGSRANHLLDCFNYAAAAGDFAGARLIADPNAPPTDTRRRAGVMTRYRRRT